MYISSSKSLLTLFVSVHRFLYNNFMPIAHSKISLFPLIVLAVIGILLPLSLRADFNIAIPAGFHFARTLKSGARGIDVRYLQILLNRNPETQVNTPGLLGGAGNETDFFGGATGRAVINFQNKYFTEVLRPAGLASGTGFVGTLTRAKLNALLETYRVKPFRAESVLLATAEPLFVPSPSMEAPGNTATVTPRFSFDELNGQTRPALVNILCTTKSGGSFRPISGSGVVVDPRGIILTNAHIGQYLLLKDYLTKDFIDCVIRTGEPARNRYRATLLYLSPDWIRENASKITEDESTGTGENDFALLLITDAANTELQLPSTFNYIPIDFSNNSLRGAKEVLAAAYPAGFLSGITIQKDLYPTSSVVRVGDIYSFGDKTPDIFSIGGSVLAQAGSSGGAVVSQEGNLMGLIVTSSVGGTTDERNLNALSMSHISNSFKRHTGDDIASLFAGDVRISEKSFNENVAPTLKKLLVDVLTKD